MVKGLILLGVLLVLATLVGLYLSGTVTQRRRKKAVERGTWEVSIEDGKGEYVGHVEVYVVRVVKGESSPVYMELVDRVPPGPFQESGVLEAQGRAISLAEVANRDEGSDDRR